jgi:formate C-acetyltransferase
MNTEIRKFNMLPGERAKKVRQGVQIKSLVVKRFATSQEFLHAEVTAVPGFKEGTKICTERASLYKESFLATEGEPMVIRRAKALTHILDNMTVYILPYELIVGNFASNPSALPMFPELGQWWLYDALDNDCKELVPNDDVKKEAKDLLKFWKGKSISDIVIDALPLDLKPFVEWNGASNTFLGAWRSTEIVDFEKVLTLGLNGIIKQVEERLARLDSEFEVKIGVKNYVSKKDNIKAMLVALKAGVRFGKRYADKARELAEKETDKRRKIELNRIAEVCDWVPANPARTLHEAMQACFFVNLICKQMLNYGQSGGNRLDVLFNPYYLKDKGEGRITREEARELVECWLLKFLERGKLVTPNLHAASMGNSDWVNFIIGGLSSDGEEDVTNEYSYIVLDALETTRVIAPTISIRYNSKTPDELLLRTIDILSTGIGHPNFFNDKIAIDLLMSNGVPRELALNWGVSSCVMAQIPGACMYPWSPHSGHFSFIKCLELALYQGMDKPIYSGKQLGARTPDPRSFTNINDLMEAYLTQVRFQMEKQAKIWRIAGAIVEKFMQQPFNSAFIRGFIEEARDCTDSDNEYFSTTIGLGLTNVVDSLAAVKKMVFDDKEITMDELIQDCRNNFEGYENLRQRLINKVPKFGNDDDYVDLIAKEVHIRSNEEIRKFKNFNGRHFLLDSSIAVGYLGLSKTTGATPDGKRDGETCADALLSPMAGRDKKGPTAVLKSLSKIPVTYLHLFNQRFLPQLLRGDNKGLFMQYLRTWGELGIFHVQFNAVDTDTLLNAQKHPENYQDLIVRVAGYSAYYVDLSMEIQNEIIKRTQQGFA